MNDAAKEVGCGSVAGMAGKLIEYPFDTVKVRLQCQGVIPKTSPTSSLSSVNNKNNSSLKNAEKSFIRFNGPLDCFRYTIKHEGFIGLYRGIAAPIFGAGVENASLFLSYMFAQSLLLSFKNGNGNQAQHKNLSLKELVLCGGISGAITSYFLTPIELIKCKMQVQRLADISKPDTKLPNAWELIKQVYVKDGIKGFWHGQLGTLLRESGGSAAWFGTYEIVMSYFKKHSNAEIISPTKENSKPRIQETLLAGACSGVMYNLSLFPADSIKSKMQTNSILNNNSGASNLPRGFFAVGREMYLTGGIRAFYNGCGITCLRAAPSSAIIFWSYEFLKGLVK